MTIKAYYNEIEPYAAQWLRNLIAANLIAPGDVDERSIEDVRPEELKEYRQCHFFAGIGIWSLALRQAGWPDDRSVWTGSCPCQPFSTAGKGDGVDDERHLWPAWFHLISKRKPDVIFGEQVETAIKHSWLDLVQSDLEGIGYAVGATGLPACGFGAPHIRQRLWFVADAESGRREGRGLGPTQPSPNLAAPHSVTGQLGDPVSARLEGHAGDGDHGQGPGREHASEGGSIATPGSTNGFWRDADWLPFRDGKIRPVEPGTFPLVDGNPTVVGRLRAYGNAIVSEVAKEFIEAFMKVRP